MNQIFTIGHSNRQWNEFTCLLEDNHVTTIVDVRRYPGSKSFPQFNKENMAKELLAKNMGYTHIEKLGGRRKEIAKASVHMIMADGKTSPLDLMRTICPQQCLKRA